MRLIVQSRTTGKFLCPSLDDGQPTWVRSLAEAGGGVVTDPEMATQLLEDWADFDDEPVIVDLDVLGTADEGLGL
ncbi:hypothetical protein [Aquabacterium sp. CECT 9606]|uniref:hypothetical protein n=1 Tax=Aquabacterium sp. CECT 9606 TaxID=2845822 RepID=UPI001E41AFD2|nr:hypothetical protein [Aquabacterium sp. CECT 9606]